MRGHHGVGTTRIPPLHFDFIATVLRPRAPSNDIIPPQPFPTMEGSTHGRHPSQPLVLESLLAVQAHLRWPRPSTTICDRSVTLNRNTFLASVRQDKTRDAPTRRADPTRPGFIGGGKPWLLASVHSDRTSSVPERLRFQTRFTGTSVRPVHLSVCSIPSSR